MIDNLDKKIFSNTAYQIFGKLITSFLGFVTTALIARYFGVVGFGQYSLIYVYLGLGAVFADFGLGTLVIREVAAKRASKNFFAGVFSLRFLLNFSLVLLSVCVYFFLPYSQSIKKGIVLAFLGNSFLSLSSILWAVYQAKLKFLRVVLGQIFSSFVSFLLVLFGVRFSFPFLFFIIAGVIGNLAGFLYSLKTCYSFPNFFIFDKKLYKKIIFEVWPIGLGAIMTTFYFKIDSLILSFFFNPQKVPDLGFYSAAYRYFEVAGVFAGFFQMTTFPVISGELRKKNFDFLYKRLFKYATFIGLSSTVGLVLLSKPLILILGKEFIPAVASLRILALSLGIMVVSGVWLSIGVAGKKQQILFWFSLVALLLNSVSNIIAIPRFSYIGASWTAVLTQSFIAITNFLVARMVVKPR